MIRIQILIPFLFAVISSKAQGFDDNNIIKRVSVIPTRFTNSTLDIATYINANFTSEREKARAIYAWVTSNISYSTDSANIINLGGNDEAKITYALRRRKGVCENYTAIFNDIALKCGLTSFIVSGYTKQGGVVDKIGHSWATLRIDKEWQLFDPTWDEANMDPKYFMMRPVDFIETHMPYDPLWQLLYYPLTHQEFSGSYRKTNGPYFNYVDSINAYLQMDSLHKLHSSALRMQKNNLEKELVRNNYKFLKMQIETINQDKDVDLYNSAVADMNDATAILNSFIQYRNNKFTPQKSDSEVDAMFDRMETMLHLSKEKLEKIDRSPATFTIGTDHVKDRINALFISINQQKDYIKRYTASGKNVQMQ